MLEIKSPFSMEELDEALLELSTIEFDREEVAKKMADFHANLPSTLSKKDEENFTQVLCQKYGVKLQDLVKTFGRAFLHDTYVQNVVTRSISRLSNALGLTPIQVWALFLNSTPKPAKAR